MNNEQIKTAQHPKGKSYNKMQSYTKLGKERSAWMNKKQEHTQTKEQTAH